MHLLTHSFRNITASEFFKHASLCVAVHWYANICSLKQANFLLAFYVKCKFVWKHADLFIVKYCFVSDFLQWKSLQTGVWRCLMRQTKQILKASASASARVDFDGHCLSSSLISKSLFKIPKYLKYVKYCKCCKYVKYLKYVEYL